MRAMVQTATAPADYEALTSNAALIDLSNRGRLCLIGNDRQAFINGQVTNNVKNLRAGQGCYAALVNAKGKMTCDLNVFVLQDEILLDFEAGLATKVTERLQKFIVADDVEIVDASGNFGLLSVVGPNAAAVCESLGWPIPNDDFAIVQHGGMYIARTQRLGPAIDVFYSLTDENPAAALERAGAKPCSTDAFETARIEQGIPRFGVDMDETTLAPESLDQRAISYAKGCYIGQEVIARIRTYGQVARALRGLRFDAGASVPNRGDKIVHDGKEVGQITSARFSPKLQRPIALGYVRKECNQIGARLEVGGATAEVVSIPFQP